jgi:hypothetical protein
MSQFQCLDSNVSIPMSRFQCLDFNVSIGVTTASPRGLSASSLPAPRMGDTFEMQPRLLRPAMETFGLDAGAGDCCFAIGYTKPIVHVMRGNSVAAYCELRMTLYPRSYARIVRPGSLSESTAMVEDFRAFGKAPTFSRPSEDNLMSRIVSSRPGLLDTRGPAF